MIQHREHRDSRREFLEKIASAAAGVAAGVGGAAIERAVENTDKDKEERELRESLRERARYARQLLDDMDFLVTRFEITKDLDRVVDHMSKDDREKETLKMYLVKFLGDFYELRGAVDTLEEITRIDEGSFANHSDSLRMKVVKFKTVSMPLLDASQMDAPVIHGMTANMYDNTKDLHDVKAEWAKIPNKEVPNWPWKIEEPDSYAGSALPDE